MELSRGIGADQLSDKSVAVLPLALERKQTYLETLGINDRLEMLIQDLEKEKEMDEVAEFIKRVAVDKENIKDEVREFMDQYTTVHYSFSQNEGYRFHKL